MTKFNYEIQLDLTRLYIETLRLMMSKEKQQSQWKMAIGKILA